MKNSEEITKAKAKLAKLLALSASSNENEAALAMEKAKEIMDKYSLRTIDVAADGGGAHVGNTKIEGLTKTAQTWEAALGWSIAAAFDGEAVRARCRTGWTMTFIAGKSDLEIIADLYVRLRLTIRRMSQSYVNQEKHKTWIPPKTLHNNYRHGMVDTISRRLDKLKENTTPAPVYAGGKDLMVVKSKAVSQVKKRMFPKCKTARTSTMSYDRGAYNKGQADGNNVSLHCSIPGGGSPIGIGA